MSEIRAKEARAQLSVDGQPLQGSFSTIHDVNIKPDVEMAKKRFVGEKRFRGDLDIKGWDIAFKCEQRDHLWMQLWDLIQSRELNNQPLPDITLEITFAYRDGSNQLKTISLHGDMVLKMDEFSIPKDGYLMNSWSGCCAYNTASNST